METSDLVYRELNEYLRGLKPPSRVNPIWALLPLLAFVGTLFGDSTRLAAPLFALWTIVAMALIYGALRARQRHALREREVLEHHEWIATLTRFAENGQLEERSHPGLIELLEACAQLRRSTLDALKSPEWHRLVERPGWKEVQTVCRETAESLFRDALWAAKAAFRPLGARRETFRKRCEDPGFASASLGAVRLAKDQLASLLSEVSDDPFAAHEAGDALARARAELNAIRDAEEEVRALQ